jgi:hypothetical protein
VLFVGAGIGGHLARPDGSKSLNATELATDLAKHFNIETSSTDLANVGAAKPAHPGIRDRSRKPLRFEKVVPLLKDF